MKAAQYHLYPSNSGAGKYILSPLDSIKRSEWKNKNGTSQIFKRGKNKKSKTNAKAYECKTSFERQDSKSKRRSTVSFNEDNHKEIKNMKQALENNFLKACQKIGADAGKKYSRNEITPQQMEKVYSGLLEIVSKGKEVLSIFFTEME